MSAVAIVEVFDVIGHGDGQLEIGPPLLAVQEFDLHGAPERLHGGVVVAVADGAHGADEPEAADVLGEGPGGELTAVIRMDDRARSCSILEALALAKASLTKTASHRRSMAQPTTLRLKRSSTTQQ